MMTDAKHTPTLLSDIEFLEQVASGCTSGSFAEWPQLRPACKRVATHFHAMRGMLERCRRKLEQAANGYDDPDLMEDVEDLAALLDQVRDKQETKI